VIVGVGLAVRLGVLALLARTPIEGDALSYHETAVDLAARVAYEPHWPPGLPSLLGAAYAVLGPREAVGRVVMLLVYLAFCAALRAVGERLGGRRTASLALLIFAVTPNFVWTSVTTLTQLPCAALALGIAYFADRCRDRRGVAWSAGLLGLCLAGLLLTRPSSISLVCVVPVYLLYRTRRWETLAVPAAIVVLLTSAWCFKAWRMTGRFVFINNANSQNVFYGNNPYTPLYRTWWYGSHKDPGEMDPGFADMLNGIGDHPPGERDPLYVKAALDHIRTRPDLFAIRTGSRVRTFFAFDTFTSAQVAKVSKPLGALVLALDAGLFMLTAALALALPAVVWTRDGWTSLMRSTGAPVREGDEAAAAAWRDDRKEQIRILMLVALVYAVPYFFAFSHPTFHAPVTPLVGVVGALAGVGLLERGVGAVWAGLSSRRRLLTAAALVALCAIQVEWVVYLVQRVP
jgi:4-amino-4-deoxy-L-arabinose transferase-like glycosyltransferase